MRRRPQRAHLLAQPGGEPERGRRRRRGPRAGTSSRRGRAGTARRRRGAARSPPELEGGHLARHGRHAAERDEQRRPRDGVPRAASRRRARWRCAGEGGRGQERARQADRQDAGRPEASGRRRAGRAPRAVGDAGCRGGAGRLRRCRERSHAPGRGRVCARRGVVLRVSLPTTAPRPPARAWVVWAVALLAYAVAVFHRASLGVAGLAAQERFDAGRVGDLAVRGASARRLRRRCRCRSASPWTAWAAGG